MERYIITGGPGCGKTSIINYLELKNNEYVIREAAEDYIALKQAEGEPEPWNEPNFQDGILELQLKRKEKVPDNLERAFYDRDVPDNLAYIEKGAQYDRIYKIAKEQDYAMVFIIESLDFMNNTAIRRESHEEANEIGKRLREAYRSVGYEPISIPKAKIEERAETIMRYVRKNILPNRPEHFCGSV